MKFASLLLPTCLFLAIAAHAADHWEVQYIFDQNLSRFVINDLKFPSAKRGIAAGYTLKNNKTNPTVLLTSDGGAHWTFVPVKEEPISLFFLDDTIGWMVTDKGLWQTDEAGRVWKKLPAFPKDLARVYFLDRKHGWAIGDKMQVLETLDGAATWSAIPVLNDLKVTPEYTSFGAIAFGNKNDGIISGWNVPPRRNSVPEWMEPSKATARHSLPGTLVVLQTSDGGHKWDPTTASIFGRVTRISIAPSGDSIGLVEFDNTFQWPCEVYRFHKGGGESTRIYRKADRLITDILLTETGTSYFAGSEVTSVIRDNPIPGKLKIIRTTDDQNFEEMPVDYRASAHRAIIAAAPTTGAEPNIWVATDTGTILKLVTSPTGK